jgi:hypothetical protein
MPLHDHPYSDENIIYSVVQAVERTTERGTNLAPNIKKLCNSLIWKCVDRLYWFFFIYGVLTPLSTIFQLYHGDQFVCQTNMHLIMWIENAFKFCGKLIHFYKERISFLFYTIIINNYFYYYDIALRGLINSPWNVITM